MSRALNAWLKSNSRPRRVSGDVYDMLINEIQESMRVLSVLQFAERADRQVLSYSHQLGREREGSPFLL